MCRLLYCTDTQHLCVQPLMMTFTSLGTHADPFALADADCMILAYHTGAHSHYSGYKSHPGLAHITL